MVIEVFGVLISIRQVVLFVFWGLAEPGHPNPATAVPTQDEPRAGDASQGRDVTACRRNQRCVSSEPEHDIRSA
jgi:hypothetical protein